MTMQLWGATVMGLPDVSLLPDYFVISSRFFLVSLGLEVLVFLTNFYLLTFTLYRFIKKMDNPKVYKDAEEVAARLDGGEDRPEEDVQGEIKKEEENLQQNRLKDMFFPTVGTSVMSRLKRSAYPNQDRFNLGRATKKRHRTYNGDELQVQPNHGQNDQVSANEEEQSFEDNQFNQSQQQYSRKLRLFKYEDCLYRLVPFYMIQVYCVNNFTCDFISLGCLVLTILFYMMFVMFDVWSQYVFLRNIHLFPILASFVPFFLNQQNFSI